MDAYEFSSGVFKKNFSETLLIPVHATTMGKHKVILYKVFHNYLNKIQKINSVVNVSINQSLKGVFFSLYAWNAGPVDGTDIA